MGDRITHSGEIIESAHDAGQPALPPVPGLSAEEAQAVWSSLNDDQSERLRALPFCDAACRAYIDVLRNGRGGKTPSEFVRRFLDPDVSEHIDAIGNSPFQPVVLKYMAGSSLYGQQDLCDATMRLRLSPMWERACERISGADASQNEKEALASQFLWVLTSNNPGAPECLREMGEGEFANRVVDVTFDKYTGPQRDLRLRMLEAKRLCLNLTHPGVIQNLKIIRGSEIEVPVVENVFKHAGRSRMPGYVDGISAGEVQDALGKLKTASLDVLREHAVQHILKAGNRFLLPEKFRDGPTPAELAAAVSGDDVISAFVKLKGSPFERGAAEHVCRLAEKPDPDGIKQYLSALCNKRLRIFLRIIPGDLLPSASRAVEGIARFTGIDGVMEFMSDALNLVGGRHDLRLRRVCGREVRGEFDAEEMLRQLRECVERS